MDETTRERILNIRDDLQQLAEDLDPMDLTNNPVLKAVFVSYDALGGILR